MPFLAQHPVLRLVASPQHLWRTLSLGIKTIWLHKLRSFLTALGVVFGVASVVAMTVLTAEVGGVGGTRRPTAWSRLRGWC